MIKGVRMRVRWSQVHVGSHLKSVSQKRRGKLLTQINDQLPFAERVVALSVGQVIIHWTA